MLNKNITTAIIRRNAIFQFFLSIISIHEKLDVALQMNSNLWRLIWVRSVRFDMIGGHSWEVIKEFFMIA